MTYYYRTEAKGIQSWLSRTGKLRELIGGSNLLEGMESEIKKLLGSEEPGSMVFAAGGAWIKFTDRKKMAHFAEIWPAHSAIQYPELTVVQAWSEGPFETAQNQIQTSLRSARSAFAAGKLEHGPLTVRAGRTGSPAVAFRVGGGNVAQDAAMRAMYDASRSGQDQLAEKLGVGRHVSTDMEDFGDFVGVIHIDANSVGSRIIESEFSFGQFEEFSRSLSAATSETARAALGRVFNEHADSALKCRPVVLGGDDFTVIVPAHVAMEITRVYLREFEDRTVGVAGGTLTACAGIAFVKSKWPLSDAIRLSEELCKAAKADPRNQGNQKRSLVAFHRVTTSLVDEYSDILRTDYSVRADGGADKTAESEMSAMGELRLLTMMPYSLEQLDKLIVLKEIIQERSVPKGTLRTWLDAVRRDPIEAKSHWRRMKILAKERSATWTKFANALKDLETDDEDGWMRHSPSSSSVNLAVYSTPIGDVLNLLAISKGEK